MRTICRSPNTWWDVLRCACENGWLMWNDHDNIDRKYHTWIHCDDSLMAEAGTALIVAEILSIFDHLQCKWFEIELIAGAAINMLGKWRVGNCPFRWSAMKKKCILNYGTRKVCTNLNIGKFLNFLSNAFGIVGQFFEYEGAVQRVQHANSAYFGDRFQIGRCKCVRHVFVYKLK